MLVEEGYDASSVRFAAAAGQRPGQYEPVCGGNRAKTNQTIDHRVDDIVLTTLLPAWPKPLFIIEAADDVRATLLPARSNHCSSYNIVNGPCIYFVYKQIHFLRTHNRCSSYISNRWSRLNNFVVHMAETAARHAHFGGFSSTCLLEKLSKSLRIT